MSFSIWSFIIAAVFNGFVAYLAMEREAVDAGGAAAGTLIGAAVLSAGGFFLWMILVMFFVSSTLLGKFGEEKRSHLSEIHKKDGQRDALQVAANGGIGCAAALAYGWTGSEIFFCAAAASFAAATADTWASELGVLSRRPPVSLRTFRAVEPGISGGVSLLGTAAALGGALSIGFIYLAGTVIMFGWSSELLTGAAAVTLAGVFGSFVDSILGAFVQIHYYDAAKNRLTEYSERNGQFLEAVQGVRWMDNDAVNFFCTLSAAAAAGAAYLILC